MPLYVVTLDRTIRQTVVIEASSMDEAHDAISYIDLEEAYTIDNSEDSTISVESFIDNGTESCGVYDINGSFLRNIEDAKEDAT